MTDPLNGCAPPLEWHPWYRDKTQLIDWLNERGPLANRHAIMIPIVPTVAATYSADDDTTAVVARPILIERRRAWGAAPYVGCPFVYEWNVGEDTLGRQIAGESRIRYLFGQHVLDRQCLRNHSEAW